MSAQIVQGRSLYSRIFLGLPDDASTVLFELPLFIMFLTVTTKNCNGYRGNFFYSACLVGESQLFLFPELRRLSRAVHVNF